MPIMIKCKCGKQYKAKPEHAGRRFPCKSCGATLQVPRPDASPSGGAPASPAKQP